MSVCVHHTALHPSAVSMRRLALKEEKIEVEGEAVELSAYDLAQGRIRFRYR
jgi:hypothetical protein